MKWPSVLSALLIVLCAACTADPSVTSLVVIVSSDLAVPDDIDRVTVETPGLAASEAPSADLREKPLPRSILLVHESGPYGPVRLAVSAWRGAELVVRRELQTTFVADQQSYLEVQLEDTCSGVFCAAGFTCGDGACVGVPSVDPQSQLDSGPWAPNAQRDAGKPDTGSSDAGDAGVVDDPQALEAGLDSSVPDSATSPGDAGNLADSGTTPDSGASVDGAVPIDAASPVDANVPPGPGALPVCSITRPLGGDSAQVGAPLALVGSCNDPETGVLTTGLVWSSQLDGELATGGVASTVLRSVGTHIISLCAPDPRDVVRRGCASVQLVALAPPQPTARITSIRQAGSELDPFVTGTPIVIQGVGTGLAVTLTWTDSLQGALGTGSEVSLTMPVVGRHVITLLVRDENGLQASVTRSFMVTPLTPQPH